MKKNILIGIIVLTIINDSMGQFSELSCIISRKKQGQFLVTDSKNDTIAIVSDSTENNVYSSSMHYFLLRGKGRKKDDIGQKEWQKKYLINSRSDTLSTIRHGGELIQINNQNIFREKSSTGWKYYKNGNKLICDLELYWNDFSWNYTIKNYENGDHIKYLNKIIMLSLVDLAIKRSDCSCNDDYYDDLFQMLIILKMI